MMHPHDLQGLIDRLSPINPSNYDYSNIRGIKDVFFDALSTYPRVLAVRCRLTMPQGHAHTRENPSFRSQENLLIQFIDEFKDELSIDQQRKQEQRQRIYGSDVFYFWRSNRDMAGNIYYDLFIMVNKDEYHKIGNYEGTDLSAMIIRALASVMQLSDTEAEEYYYFFARYKLSSNRPNFIIQLKYAFETACSMVKRNVSTHWFSTCHFGSSR